MVTATAKSHYPLNSLDDREFEQLLYRIFSEKIEDKKFDKKFDKVNLMPGVAEEGQDCQLILSGRLVGVIQCKKYKNNLTIDAVANSNSLSFDN